MEDVIGWLPCAVVLFLADVLELDGLDGPDGLEGLDGLGPGAGAPHSLRLSSALLPLLPPSVALAFIIPVPYVQLVLAGSMLPMPSPLEFNV